ncbi:acid-shock protein [Paraburkholderia sp. J63]|uniref:acid-shock protein n=1 Tax=Paraburkholderia sp. J63 TaxID=2805434 RepID=UPI002ABE3315|nr:acid-shock protein [Paraburkholderia sp. J63]
MKKLMLMLTAFGVAALAQPSFAQPASQPAVVHQEASAATSYSAPTQKHVKKPKKKKVKKGAASASSTAEPAAASQ